MHFLLRENVRSRTTLGFLVGLLIFAAVQMTAAYHKHALRYHREALDSRRLASDAVLLTSLNPDAAPWPRSAVSVRNTAPSEEEANLVAAEKKFAITQKQRSLHIIYRLSRFNGTGRGIARVSNLIVSLIGILGMFSAIVGALIGPWLADTSDDLGDEDRFIYWVREEEEDEDDERICGFAREEKYGMQRVLDVP